MQEWRDIFDSSKCGSKFDRHHPTIYSIPTNMHLWEVGRKQADFPSLFYHLICSYHALPMEYFHWYGYRLDLVFYITLLIHCLWRLQMISGMLELTMLYPFSPLSLVSEILIFILIYSMTWNRFQWGNQLTDGVTLNFASNKEFHQIFTLKVLKLLVSK